MCSLWTIDGLRSQDGLTCFYQKNNDMFFVQVHILHRLNHQPAKQMLIPQDYPSPPNNSSPAVFPGKFWGSKTHHHNRWNMDFDMFMETFHMNKSLKLLLHHLRLASFYPFAPRGVWNTPPNPKPQMNIHLPTPNEPPIHPWQKK